MYIFQRQCGTAEACDVAGVGVFAAPAVGVHGYVCYYRCSINRWMSVDSEKLLAVLADGEFHSGENIGAALGISRTAVWKQLHKLEGLGLAIESIKGRGYRLLGGVSLLDAERIRVALAVHSLPGRDNFELLSVVDSTNSHAMRMAGERGHGYFCLAEQQTGGRGRRGRHWQSPYGRNIYLSMVWEFQTGAAALEGLSLSVGLALARVLARRGVVDVGLKWPNDVLVDGAKLAGILLEMQGDPSGLCQVIVGVGVNLDMTGVDTTEITQAWVDLKSLAGDVDRNQFAADLVVELNGVLAGFRGAGFAAFREEWLALDVYRDRDVALQLGENYCYGVARGVDAAGGLIVDLDGGERKVFMGGEVSLRMR